MADMSQEIGSKTFANIRQRIVPIMRRNSGDRVCAAVMANLFQLCVPRFCHCATWLMVLGGWYPQYRYQLYLPYCCLATFWLAASVRYKHESTLLRRTRHELAYRAARGEVRNKSQAMAFNSQIRFNNGRSNKWLTAKQQALTMSLEYTVESALAEALNLATSVIVLWTFAICICWSWSQTRFGMGAASVLASW